MGTCRLDAKGETQGGGPPKGESTDARHGGGVARSSDESSVMEPKRRGGNIKLYTGINRSWEESPWIKQSRQRLDDGSRMRREAHVRFCESARGKLPRATLLLSHLPQVWADAFGPRRCSARVRSTQRSETPARPPANAGTLAQARRTWFYTCSGRAGERDDQ